MSDFRMLIGYRNTSSWSMRPWLVLAHAGVAFDQALIEYRKPEMKEQLLALSPTGKVPLLIHRRPEGNVSIWESLAICEYLAECFPEAGFWPKDPIIRALARSAATEMHGGFSALRNQLPMDVVGRHEMPEIDAQCIADIARIQAIWTQCLGAQGARGGEPFLFGRFSIADAMYAPVVSRFRSYGVPIEPSCQGFVDAVLADPAFKAWEAAAAREPVEAH